MRAWQGFFKDGRKFCWKLQLKHLQTIRLLVQLKKPHVVENINFLPKKSLVYKGFHQKIGKT